MLNRLVGASGTWEGTSTLQDPNSGQPESSPSRLDIVPMLDGRFVRLDYTWAYQGKPQSGSLLLGHRRKAGVFTGHWIDSWHNGDGVMACEGPSESADFVIVLGSYPAPPGPDWGWRIQLAPGDGTLGIVMHNLSPDGQEYLAVDATYTRAG